MSKEFTVQVIRKVTKIETARIEVESPNKTMARGAAQYAAVNEPAEWTAGDDEITVISSKVVGEASSP